MAADRGSTWWQRQLPAAHGAKLPDPREGSRRVLAVKALGAMLPSNRCLGAGRTQMQRAVHSAPRKREPSKNNGHRAQYHALEAWYGSTESSLSRLLGALPCLFFALALAEIPLCNAAAAGAAAAGSP